MTVGPWGPGTYCLEDEIVRLRALHAELVEALEAMVAYANGRADYRSDAVRLARAALAKAKGGA